MEVYVESFPTNASGYYARGWCKELAGKAHGWKGDGVSSSSTKEFLDAFSNGRPGTKYALKNTADFLEDI